jgi:hypothetical protein
MGYVLIPLGAVVAGWFLWLVIRPWVAESENGWARILRSIIWGEDVKRSRVERKP